MKHFELNMASWFKSTVERVNKNQRKSDNKRNSQIYISDSGVSSYKSQLRLIPNGF